ncbi:hypothetical protein [Virgibacillus halodenitrificans]|uniref:hypothetical protein n=1 Tax=Virgibacillus halodenitrificans TaxID=1482 RepID=UPI000EF4DF7C|nr:hypothetical protein [Virgibacillus halodenitrificans]
MQTCPNCNQTQNAGKFCGNCGEILQDNNQNSAISDTNPTVEQAATTVNTQTQQAVSTAKDGLTQYWSYFLSLLKNPTTAFQTDERHLINGLITIILFAITASLSIYFLANSLFKATMGGFLDANTNLPFFAINARLTFIMIITLAIAFGSILGMVKIVHKQSSYKNLLTQYGSLLVPFTGLNVIAMIGGLTASIKLTLFPLVISSSLSFLFIPVLLVYEKASKVDNQGQKVYLSLATAVLIIIISYFIGSTVLDNMMEDIDDLFNYY